MVLPDGAQNVEAIELRQVGVEQHQIGPKATKQLQSLGAVARNAGSQSMAFQMSAENGGDGRIVIGHQHQRRGRVGGQMLSAGPCRIHAGLLVPLVQFL